MSSKLSKATGKARKGLILFLIFAISTFVVRFIYGFASEETGLIRPTPVPSSPYMSANQALGKIPKPEISSIPLSTGSAPRYSLQNRDTLPDFPPVVNIYEINKPREKLGNTNQGRRVAEKLKFSGREKIVEQTTMFWQTEDTSRTLNYNKLLEIWDYKTDLNKERLDQEQRELIGITDEESNFSTIGNSIISSLSLDSTFFNQANSTTRYVDINRSSNSIVKSIEPSNANFVHIAQYKKLESGTPNPLYRPSQGELPTTSFFSDVRKQDFRKGIADIILRGMGQQLLPDLVSFDYKEYSYGQKGIYNILTPEEAFIKVQNSQGTIYWLKLLNENFYSNPIALNVLEFEIRGDDVSLIYIEPNEWQEDKLWTNFLQPFYMFEGVALLADGREANFAIILPALKDVEYM